MQRVTQKQLEALCELINARLNTPMQPWARDAAGKLKAQIGNYHLDYAYGGVNLAKVTSEGGGITCPLGQGYRTKRELERELQAFIRGLECPAMPNQAPAMSPTDCGEQVAFVSSLQPKKV